MRDKTYLDGLKEGRDLLLDIYSSTNDHTNTKLVIMESVKIISERIKKCYVKWTPSDLPTTDQPTSPTPPVKPTKASS